MTDYTRLPLYEHLRSYIDTGRPVGHFLTELLSNRLVEAFSRADDRNLVCMHLYAQFIYNQAPRGCWGSPDAVRIWQSHRGLAGLEAYPARQEDTE